eukprot:scaffold15862_cov86-Skeletonema_marinoi.AAC.3
MLLLTRAAHKHKLTQLHLLLFLEHVQFGDVRYETKVIGYPHPHMHLYPHACAVTALVKRYMISISWRKHEHQKIPPQKPREKIFEQPRSVDVSQC